MNRNDAKKLAERKFPKFVVAGLNSSLSTMLLL